MNWVYDKLLTMLSIIIPSYKDPYLAPTIQSLLDQAWGKIEVVVVLDGYKPDIYIEDPRVKYIHQENKGMREAINVAVANSKGDYIMRTDEHATFGIGYDLLLTSHIKDNWIVKPRRYKLDVEKWEVMDEPYIDYEKLVIDKSHNKFHGVEWTNRSIERKAFAIDEDMAMQGSCWVMPRSWWEKTIVRLDSTGYHTHYQDSIEMLFKTWEAGGKLMLNKKTWHAHKHRKFNRSHNYPSKLARESWDYALKVHGDYYKEVIYPRFFGKKYEN